MITIHKLNVHVSPSSAHVLGLLATIARKPAAEDMGSAVQATAHLTPPAIGERWPEQGGIYLGTMRGAEGKPSYHLIVNDSDAGVIENIDWGNYGKEVAGATCHRDGLANTVALVAMGDATHPAAVWADKLTIGDHSDYYLPSRAEIQLGFVHAPQLFSEGPYWTSTQYSSDFAWVQYSDGLTYIGNQGGKFRARVFRRLLID